jgi:hypothetical protein
MKGILTSDCFGKKQSITTVNGTTIIQFHIHNFNFVCMKIG